MNDYVVLVTTTDSRDAAQALARAALEAKLAACVQIFPVESHYVWRDELCAEPEFLLQMKLCAQDYDALAALVRRLHGYETPEILRFDIADGDRDYLGWIAEVTKK